MTTTCLLLPLPSCEDEACDTKCWARRPSSFDVSIPHRTASSIIIPTIIIDRFRRRRRRTTTPGGDGDRDARRQMRRRTIYEKEDDDDRRRIRASSCEISSMIFVARAWIRYGGARGIGVGMTMRRSDSGRSVRTTYIGSNDHPTEGPTTTPRDRDFTFGSRGRHGRDCATTNEIRTAVARRRASVRRRTVGTNRSRRPNFERIAGATRGRRPGSISFVPNTCALTPSPWMRTARRGERT